MKIFLKENGFKLIFIFSLVIVSTGYYCVVYQSKKVIDKNDGAIVNRSTLDLQEKCSKRAEQFLEGNKHELFSSIDAGKMSYIADHTNHYNKQLDKCFLHTSEFFVLESQNKGFSSTEYLYDVYENKKYASFHKFVKPEEKNITTKPQTCEMLEEDCIAVNQFGYDISQEKFDKFVGNYMEH